MRSASGPLRASSASGSTATACGRELRLVDCPKCGDRIIKIRSKKEETYGEISYKCPSNVRDDPTTCDWIRSEKQYATFLRNLDAREEQGGRFKIVEHGMMEEQGIGEFKKQVEGLKQVVEMHSTKISDLKKQMFEEKKGSQKTVVVDKTVLLGLCVGLVLGILVTVMLK